MTITELLDSYTNSISDIVKRLKTEADKVRLVQDKRVRKSYYEGKIVAYNEIIELLKNTRG